MGNTKPGVYPAAGHVTISVWYFLKVGRDVQEQGLPRFHFPRDTFYDIDGTIEESVDDNCPPTLFYHNHTYFT